MGINRLSAIKYYWSVEGLGNPLIQKAMTRTQFWEILKNMHFADNLQNLLPIDTLRKKCPYSELFCSAFSRIWTE